MSTGLTREPGGIAVRAGPAPRERPVANPRDRFGKQKRRASHSGSRRFLLATVADAAVWINYLVAGLADRDDIVER